MREKMGILKRSVRALSKMFSLVQRFDYTKKGSSSFLFTPETIPLDQSNTSAISILLINSKKELNAALYRPSKKSRRNAAC
jgi:hypothetical protein